MTTRFRPHALGEVALVLSDRPNTALLYTDEDKLDERGDRFDPYFKPDWNPALVNGQNLFSHLGVYRTDLIRSVGGFREGFEGAQDWDLLLRCAERVDPVRIHHIPQILYHWRAAAGSTAMTLVNKDYAIAAQERVVYEHARRCGIEIAIKRVVNGVFLQADPVIAKLPPISLIIGHPSAMGSSEAANRWRAHAEAGAVEFIPVALESESPRELGDTPLWLSGGDARAINAAAATAKGELIVFVAAGAIPADKTWLAQLVAHAVQPANGCVGGVTFDAARRTARGGYILNSDTIAATAFFGEYQGFIGMMGRNQIVQNLSALCLMGLAVRRATWNSVQGLDVAHLGARYHDVDLCLRIAERGLRNVWHPGIVFLDERPLRVRGSTPPGSAEQDEDAARSPHSRSGWPRSAIPGCIGLAAGVGRALRGTERRHRLDCDEAGRVAPARWRRSRGVAAEIRIVDLAPERDDGYDLSDFLRSETVAQLEELVSEARLADPLSPDEMANGARRHDSRDAVLQRPDRLLQETPRGRGAGLRRSRRLGGATPTRSSASARRRTFTSPPQNPQAGRRGCSNYSNSWCGNRFVPPT